MLGSLLFSGPGCGGGSDGPSSSASIGPSGGSITSADGKVTLTIPAGALSQTITVSLSKSDDGAAPDPDLISGTTYKLDTPSVTLSAPATLKYDLKDALLTHVVSGLHLADAQFVGTCDASTPTCYVVLGSGPCPADHDKLDGIVNLTTANGAPISPVWAEQCDLSDPAQPLLATVEPTVVIGGSYDPATFALTAGLGGLSPALFGAIDSKFNLELDGPVPRPPIDGTAFGKTNEQPDVFTFTPSRPASVAKYKYYFDSGFGIQSDGSPIDKLLLQGVFLGESTAPTFSQKFGSLLAPGATYAFLFFEVDALDAADNVLTAGVVVVPVTYGSQLQLVLVADPVSVTAPGNTVLSAKVPNSILGTGIQKVEFFEGTKKIGEDTTVNYELVIPYTQANNGTHTYTAKVTDQSNNTATSNNVSVNVAINVAPTFDLYIDPVNGLDTNPGTLALPFKSITHMATLATSGQKIGLLDGMYLEGTIFDTCDGGNVIVPGGLTIQSVHPRAAVIANITLGVSTGSVTFIDLTMDGGSGHGGCTSLSSSSTSAGATMTMSGIKFNNSSHILLSGSVVATLAPGTLVGSMIGGTVNVLGELTNSAQLTIHGGLIDGGATGGCGLAQFELDTSSRIVLDGVTIQNWESGTISLRQSSSALLENNTILSGTALATGCNPVIEMNDASTATIQNSTIENNPNENAFYVKGGTGMTVNLSGATLKANYRGLFHDTNFGDAAVAVTMTNTTLTQSVGEALSWYSAANPGLTLTARNSQITSNAVGFFTNVAAGTTLDLGTGASAGGNTIQNTGVGLYLAGAGVIATSAAGNTWVVGAQGADGAGHYAAALLTGPAAAGSNYRIDNASTIQF